jgi:Fic family protein
LDKWDTSGNLRHVSFSDIHLVNDLNYYQVVSKCLTNKDNDLTEFIKFYLKVIWYSLKRSFVTQLGFIHKLNDRQVKFLSDETGDFVTLASYASVNGVSVSTARRDADKLIELRFIEKGLAEGVVAIRSRIGIA